LGLSFSFNHPLALCLRFISICSSPTSFYTSYFLALDKVAGLSRNGNYPGSRGVYRINEIKEREEKRGAHKPRLIRLNSAVFTTSVAKPRTKRNRAMRTPNSRPRRLPEIIGSAARRLRRGENAAFLPFREVVKDSRPVSSLFAAYTHLEGKEEGTLVIALPHSAAGVGEKLLHQHFASCVVKPMSPEENVLYTRVRREWALEDELEARRAEQEAPTGGDE